MYDTATLAEFDTNDQGMAIFLVTYTGPGVRPVSRRYETAIGFTDDYLVMKAQSALDNLNASVTFFSRLQRGQVLVQR